MNRSVITSVIVCLAVVLMFAFCRQTNPAQGTSQTNSDNVTQSSIESDLTGVSFTPVDNGESSELFEYETDMFVAVFDTHGAVIRDLYLKKFPLDENGVSNSQKYRNFIFHNTLDNPAFMLYWGDNLNNPVSDDFSYEINGEKIIFRKTYVNDDGSFFTLNKTYQLKDGEYLFSVDVSFSGNVPDNGKFAYTLGFAPQVGPEFETIKNDNYNYRRFYVGYGLVSNKKGKIKSSNITNSLHQNLYYNETNDFKWIELTGKYFSVIISPEDTQQTYKYTAIRETGTADHVSQIDTVYVSVYSEEKAESERFYVYCGPQLKKYLGSYYSPSDNAWGLRNMDLDMALEGGSVLGWLESFFKMCLQLLYKLIHNYGICIIVLTLLIKILTWPLQQKSMNSAAQMSALSPMMEEIKQKYPNNPQKQNVEMQSLYSQYGISPLSGCMPVLLLFLQFPILIAFYGLLNKHIELMGQPFVWWINDLSVPETVAVLPFNIPVLGNQIHILPFLYVATSIFVSVYTQKSNKNSQQKNMWFLTYGMPVIFLFLLYSAPSGVFVYWISQSVFSFLQQLYMNIKLKKKGGVQLNKIEKKGNNGEPPLAVQKYRERLKKLEEMKKQQNKKNRR